MSRRPDRIATILRATAVAAGVLLVATPLVTAQEPDLIEERISFAYKAIKWSAIDARAKLEADFRRAVAAKKLDISSAEIAGAAAAAAGGVTHEDSWDVRTAIRGCGPAKQLCFVITCDQCSR